MLSAVASLFTITLVIIINDVRVNNQIFEPRATHHVVGL
jgi:hypothetical protein